MIFADHTCLPIETQGIFFDQIRDLAKLDFPRKSLEFQGNPWKSGFSRSPVHSDHMPADRVRRLRRRGTVHIVSTAPSVGARAEGFVVLPRILCTLIF